MWQYTGGVEYDGAKYVELGLRRKVSIGTDWVVPAHYDFSASTVDNYPGVEGLFVG